MTKGKDLKPHIGIFGRRNVGKSSLINALVNQEVSIVSAIAGTTTDSVKKSMEIFGIGPAIIVDTAGIDDSGDLGRKRVAKTLEVINTIDCAILVTSDNTFGDFETELITNFVAAEIPYLIVHNKNDKQPLSNKLSASIQAQTGSQVIDFSAKTKEKLEELTQLLKKIFPETSYQQNSLFQGFLNDRDIVLLVTPIDSEAPDGRMILPQVMAIRDILDHNCICIVLKETELSFYMSTTNIQPKMVVTDSQAFDKVSKLIPNHIPLTGFSILFARLKGNFDFFIQGTPALKKLNDGNRILILESCTHRVSCEDIGQFKIPKWITEYSGKKLQFDFASGFSNLKRDINEYSLVIQCGGCMFTKKQVTNRLKPAIEAGIPVTNYGMTIAWINGIFERATEIFSKNI